MAKVLVEIDLGDVDMTNEDWFPYGPEEIAIDSAYLKQDPEEDSFYLFKLVETIF